MSRNLPPSYGALVVVLAFLLLATPPVEAGGGWLSETRDIPGPPHKVDSARTLFDVTISLYRSPSGDDDPATDMPGEEQTTYESIIEHWADSVCEQTNGAHQLGEVRIFRDGAFSDRADVIWTASEWPRAHISGFGTDSLHILFGDTFPNGCGDGCDHSMLGDPEGAGYTLGHEWAHYVYGLYDEYQGRDETGPIHQPRSTDVPPEPSIMNSQWMARGGAFEWLNHSTEDNYEAETAQGRVYAASGWEVLVRDPDDDPRDGDRSGLPRRVRYTTLAAEAPTAADGWVREELPGERATCRSQLEIRWMADADLELQVVIDRSGSMGGSPIDNAKTAASNLVEVVPGGQTALGVVAFASSEDQLVPITPIPDPGTAVRDQIQATIASIFASGSTAMFDGADLALTNLEQYRADNGTTANRAVFLLSDGGDNSSSATEAGVIADYDAADVPLITFGYGSFAPNGVLRRLADGTGGQFFASPTTLEEIQAAFLSAVTAVSSTVAVGNIASQAPPLASAPLGSFVVDSTLETLSVVATYAGSGVDLTLAAPDGTPLTTLDCNLTGGTSSCVGSVDSATLGTFGSGSYSLSATNNSPIGTDVSATVLANPSPGLTYELTLGSPSGATVEYPEPILVTAKIGRGRLITGVDVVARVTSPDGSEQMLTLGDGGQGADGVAG
ncbi:MAG: VWA domain-containing protein, partial [Holophagales bacterium]|nr:VWA domain-containing protein [Holophagales bacterium]